MTLGRSDKAMSVIRAVPQRPQSAKSALKLLHEPMNKGPRGKCVAMQSGNYGRPKKERTCLLDLRVEGVLLTGTRESKHSISRVLGISKPEDFKRVNFFLLRKPDWIVCSSFTESSNNKEICRHTFLKD